MTPALIEISALAGFDHVIIDGEHGNVGVRDVEDLVRAAEAAGVTPLARVPSNRRSISFAISMSACRG